MNPFKVNYQYASPTGAFRSGSLILDALDADTAIAQARASLIGKLKHVKVTGATLYNPDQLELPITKKK